MPINYSVERAKNIHGNFIVFTSCDTKYFKLYGSQFLTSLNLNSPGSHCILHVINLLTFRNNFDSSMSGKIAENNNCSNITSLNFSD